VAGHHLIDDYLADLAARLPADTVEELADGLLESCQRHRATGLASADAASAALAEFGTVEQIIDAYVMQSPGRRTARMLLASGPVVGVCWGGSLAAAHAWTWPVPASAAAGFGLVLLAVVAALVTAATSRRSYRRTRLGAAGGLGLVALDVAMLTAALLAAPTPVWPMLAAVPASLARIGFTLRALPETLTR
jgi:hypothetical protein